MRRKQLHITALIGLVVSCDPAPHRRPAAPADTRQPAQVAPHAPRCSMSLSGAERFLEPGSTVLVGEVHGTRQTPLAFAELSCLAARRGSVAVALELPVDEEPVLQAYIASDEERSARTNLLAAQHWSWADQDGRGSQAMLELMSRLRELRAGGARITVHAYVPVQIDLERHEDMMATNLLRIRRDVPDATLLVLTGNLHGSTKKGTPWPELVPMGWHLAQSVQGVRSLFAAYASGTAWVCRTNHECGPSPMKGTDRGASAFVTPSSERAGYDGILYVGAIEASPPATDRSAR